MFPLGFLPVERCAAGRHEQPECVAEDSHFPPAVHAEHLSAVAAGSGTDSSNMRSSRRSSSIQYWQHSCLSSQDLAEPVGVAVLCCVLCCRYAVWSTMMYHRYQYRAEDFGERAMPFGR